MRRNLIPLLSRTIFTIVLLKIILLSFNHWNLAMRMMDFVKLMKGRRRNIADTCRSISKNISKENRPMERYILGRRIGLGGANRPNISNTRFLMSWYHNKTDDIVGHWILWCPVFKVGSSNWYFRLVNYNSDREKKKKY